MDTTYVAKFVFTGDDQIHFEELRKELVKFLEKDYVLVWIQFAVGSEERWKKWNAEFNNLYSDLNGYSKEYETFAADKIQGWLDKNINQDRVVRYYAGTVDVGSIISKLKIGNYEITCDMYLVPVEG